MVGINEVSNVYIERIAAAARRKVVEQNIISENTRLYTQEMLESIIDFFGGKVFFDERNKPSETPNIYIRKTSGNGFEIHSYSLKKPDELFMEIIHELGHAFIDLPSEKIGKKYSCDGRGASDVQAERFARAFVMPPTDFIESAKQCLVAGKFDIEKIAKIYRVNYVDALIRGKELNYWE